MKSSSSEYSETLVQLYALASRLEGEGQYNNAKLARAAADSLCRQAGYHVHVPATNQGLAMEIARLSDVLDGLGAGEELTRTMRAGADAMAAGRLPLISETPDPYVCRFCGHLVVGEPGYKCPDCGAPAATMQRFRAVYWLDALLPDAVLERLRQTPMDVASLLSSVPETRLNLPASSTGGWSLSQAVGHLLDAERVLNMRLKRLVEEDEPDLESLAVFEWAGSDPAPTPTSQQILSDYQASRLDTLKLLSSLPLHDWQRAGHHKEFGRVTICQQASYFAMHEITHMPQIARLLEPLH